MRVLYVDCDTLRPDHLGCYGYGRATSPNVDALAAQGTRFTQVYASDVPCLPSRTALFSGHFGVHTGASEKSLVRAGLHHLDDAVPEKGVASERLVVDRGVENSPEHGVGLQGPRSDRSCRSARRPPAARTRRRGPALTALGRAAYCNENTF